MPGGLDKPDRIIGSDGVEIGGGDIAVFSELALVPSVAGNPFAGFDLSHLRFDATKDLTYRGGIRKLHAVELFDTSIGNMRVRIDKTRCGRSPVEIDDANAGTIPCKLQNFGVTANFYDGPVPYGYGLRYRILFIHGQDMAMEQQKVGIRRLREYNLCQQQRGYQHAYRGEFAFQWHHRILLDNAGSSSRRS